MKRIVRQNCSGGKLGAQIHLTRSDLEQYHKGNVQQDNFLSTPYGGLTRRPPATLLGSLPFKIIEITDHGNVHGITESSVIAGTINISVAVPFDNPKVGDVITVSGTSIYDGDHVVTTVVESDEVHCSGTTYTVDNFGGTFVSARDVWMQPTTIRGFDFVYDITTKYSVLLVGYTADGENGVSIFEILSDDGTHKASITAPYAISSFYQIDNKQINDVMMFAHVDYPTAQLERHGDTDWRYAVRDMTGGPFLQQNTNRAIEASVSANLWESGTTYSEGDDVQLSTGGTIAITAASYAEWYTSKGRTYFTFRMTVASGHGYVGGDEVTIENLVGDAPDNHVFSGVYTVIRSGTAYIDINTGRYERSYVDETGGYVEWFNDYALPTAFVGSTITGGSGVGFYTSLTDSNTGNDPSVSPNEWRKTYSGITATLTSNSDLFAEADLGRKFEMAGNWSELVSGEFVQSGGAQVSVAVPASGIVQVKTTGVWDAALRMTYTVDDGVSWEKIAEFDGNDGNSNHSFSRTLPSGATLVRLESDGWTSFSGETGCYYTISTESSSVSMNIKEYVSEREVVVEIESSLKYAFTTHKWAFGAFGGAMGYPSTITIHEERLTLGGTSGRPFEFYGSEVNNWTNFALGTLETSPIIFRLNSDNVTRICWLLSAQNRLFIGTDFGEYSASTPDKDTVLSGTNPPRIQLHTTYGSDEQKSLAVHNEVVHVTADRKTLRSIAEGEYKETYGSKDLTVFSPDIGGDGIMSIALQRNPYPIIWARTVNGGLKPFTYDVENGIMGWAEVELEDTTVKSHWIMPDDDGVDEVYASVEREDIVYQASGTCSPDVTDYTYEVDLESYGAVKVSGTGTQADGGHFSTPSSTIDHGAYSRTVDSPVQSSIGWDSGVWSIYLFDITIPSSPIVIEYWTVASSSKEPPTNGWSIGNILSSPAPMIEIGDIYTNTTSSYAISVGDSGYSIYNSSNSQQLFTGAGLLGIYTAIAGSGASGSVTVAPLNNHIIKLGKLATARGECTDLFDESYESIVEFTSLIQGQGVLEADQVRVNQMHVYLVNSYGGEVSVDGGESWVPIHYDDENLYTGMKSLSVDSGITDDLRVLIRTTDNDPFEITGVSVDVEPQTTSTSRRK